MDHARFRAPGESVPMKLGKNVFLAIAAIGAGDGGVAGAAGEIDALEGAARAAGLGDADLEEVRAVAKTKGKLDGVKALKMTPDERLVSYAIATWLARVDGIVMPEEKMALMRL